MTECSYKDCHREAITTLDLEKGETPTCSEHAQDLMEQEQQAENQGPDQKLQSGSVHLDIWQNDEAPDTYSFKRFYTQDDGENFQETRNMRPRDLPHIATLIRKVKLGEVEEK